MLKLHHQYDQSVTLLAAPLLIKHTAKLQFDVLVRDGNHRRPIQPEYTKRSTYGSIWLSFLRHYLLFLSLHDQ